MRQFPTFLRLVPCAFALWLSSLLVSRSSAATVNDSQTFTIQPGWNAIYLEVSPANSAPQAVFSSLTGVQQVWSFLTPRSSVQYINDPASGLWNVPGWQVWLPTDSQHPENAALTNLPAVIGHQAYLIKYGGASATTLTISGQAAYRPVTWNPDSFTITGLPVNPASTVLAGDYFTNDPAHKAQTRYYLAATGAWLPLADTASLRRGQAYWFYTKGSSTFQAPVDFNFGGGEILDYGKAGGERILSFTNRTASAVEMTISVPGANPFLAYATTNSGNQRPTWTPLTSYVRTVPANATVPLTVGALRAGFVPGSDFGALCSVSLRGIATNGVTPQFDALLKVPVTVRTPGAAQGAALKGGETNDSESNAPNAGLWVGFATLNMVDEVNTAVGQVTNGTPVITTPAQRTGTPSPFTLRLIVHVGDNGVARLLKQVIVMKKKSTASVDPGSPALITDPALVPQFDASALRDGAPFSNRLSSIGFDYAGNNLSLTGTFGTSLTGAVAVPRTLPTNPFLHRYNPDHDDVPTTAGEVWDVSRALSFTFNGTNSNPNQPDADGASQRSGTYQETLTGLHRLPITVAGTFTLRRVNAIGALDPAP